MQKKWLTVAVATVGVASGIAGILTYLQGSAPTRSIAASGENAIAAGNDVRIGERTVIDKHDFAEDRRRQAESYLAVARGSCKSVSETVAAMTADTVIDMTQGHKWHPQELYPTEIVAQHYGEQVYRDINARLERSLQSLQLAMKHLVQNAVQSMTGLAGRQDEARKDAFAADKQAWLESTNDLCRYLDAIGR